MDAPLRQMIRDLVREVLSDALPVPSAGQQSAAMPATVNQSSETAYVPQGLVSENRVNEFAGNGIRVLEISGRVAVTPLARETARRQGLSIRRVTR